MISTDKNCQMNMVYRYCPFTRICRVKNGIMVVKYLVYLCLFLIAVYMLRLRQWRYSDRSRELANHNFSALFEDIMLFNKNTTKKPNSTIGLSKHATKALMEPHYLHTSNNDFTLVILIESGYETRRDAARRTWINMLDNKEFQIRGMKIAYFFVTMKPKSEKDKNLLEIEMEAYQDIVTFDIENTYNGLVLLTLSAVQWAYENLHYDFLMKTDDDCLINIDIVLEKIGNANLDTFIGNHMRWYQHTHFSTVKKRWSFGKDGTIVDGTKVLPYYGGLGYIIGKLAVPAVLQQSNDVTVTIKSRSFAAEDVYMSYLVQLSPDVQIQTHDDHYTLRSGLYDNYCKSGNALKESTWMILHGYVSQMFEFWNLHLTGTLHQLDCSRKYKW